MEITTIRYRGPGNNRQTHSGSFSVREAGVVLYISDNSSAFIPWHKVDEISQWFSNDMPKGERMSKHLAARLNR